MAANQITFPDYANPFMAPVVRATAPVIDGPCSYELVQSGPDVLAADCEVETPSIEVTILWDTSVLHVAHMTPPRSFYVGEEVRKNMPCDYLLPADKIGTTRAPVLLADRTGTLRLVLLPGAKGTLDLAGRGKKTVSEAIAEGWTEPSAEASGAREIVFPFGSKASVDVNGIVFRVSSGNAGRAVAGRSIATESLPYHGISFLAHVGLLAAMAALVPPLGLTDTDGISADQQYQLGQYLQAIAEKEDEAKPTEQLATDKADGDEGGQGARAKSEEGSMGSATAKATGLKWGVAGPKDNPDPHIGRNEALQSAEKFGMIGLLGGSSASDVNAPTATWGRDDSSGQDALSARGNMWGTDIGDAYGAGGLGLTGIGEGGGGRGEGIGLGGIGTIGHGSGRGDGDGIGNGHGRLAPSHKVKAPSVRVGVAALNGHLPPEIIQRVVRQNFGRFRLCYENGLRNNPSLQGRVGVRFVIGRDGAVSNVGNGGSDLPDSGVVSCVVRAFYGLSFPAPESGIVTVTYPIMFSPGG